MSPNSEFEIQITGDGSHTLYSHRFGQQFHDTNGAIDESRHVFLQYGSFFDRIRNNEDVHILEIGFGTGLNLLLVADALIPSNSSSKVRFTSIEAFPLDPETAKQLNYANYLPMLPDPDVLTTLFSESVPGFNTFSITPKLELNLFIGMYTAFEFPEQPIDIVFFDAFSPKANPELWESGIFKDIIDHAAPKCVLATYCAAVSARAAMCHAGWYVARGPGFKTRREMTIASNNADALAAYPRVNELRYTERYSSGEFTN